MFRHILSVGGFTLASRLTGFVRDIVMAAIMGTGLVADAFVVAQRLPNHFRAIFGEGAFNSAFVPTYSAALESRGREAASMLAGRLMMVLVLALGVLTALAIVFMPAFVAVLAPGFPDEPEKFALAVTLTRITFPYLLFITLVTLLSGVLNADDRFAAPAAAPILLNVAIVAALSVAWLFPTAGHAAAWGVAAAGVLELLLLMAAAKRAGCLPRPRALAMDKDMRVFFRTLGPAVIGSAGVQIAMFADTIIASLLPTGAVSSLYYADRLYQLPVGVIGIAAGTVVLPTMSRRFAAGDFEGARHAQNRAMAFTTALAAPFFVAFLLIPDLVMAALFMRGAFDQSSVLAAGAALAAYGVGLPAVVLIRSAVASFYARQDTATPLLASFSGIAVNLVLKLLLFRSMGAAGLALATAVGAWVNFALLAGLALRNGSMKPDTALRRTLVCVAAASAALAVVAWLAGPPIAHWTSGLPKFRTEAEFALLGGLGVIVYFAVLMAALNASGVPWRRG
ncbi:murein biosynthesis integral membrane protein MurJ [Alsobacter sp. SYSU M60028]|uniref:Probable lipid II flippase MurJ n=1 Tax=Alsobacter ponti TaxID=2962936 RepID=A0ABT1L8I2_9HYPH|nr:murein biosynthesis integral membrane protein MurJ [Alsobacter ponti]MCP8937815.1 murein biosynthesis integral membrane protein MurJ [Alsobacter ponti]